MKRISQLEEKIQMNKYVNVPSPDRRSESARDGKHKVSNGFRLFAGIVLLVLVAGVTLPSRSAFSEPQGRETRDHRTRTSTTDLRSAMKVMKLKEGSNVVHKGAGHNLIALMKGGKVVEWRATDDKGNPLQAQVQRGARCKVCVTTYPSPGVPRETCYEIDCTNLPPPLEGVELTSLPGSLEIPRTGKLLVRRLPDSAQGVELRDGVVRLKPGFKFVKNDNNTVTVARMSGGAGIQGTWQCFCNSDAGGSCTISTLGPTLSCRSGTCNACVMAVDLGPIRTRVMTFHLVN